MSGDAQAVVQQNGTECTNGETAYAPTPEGKRVLAAIHSYELRGQEQIHAPSISQRSGLPRETVDSELQALSQYHLVTKEIGRKSREVYHLAEGVAEKILGYKKEPVKEPPRENISLGILQDIDAKILEAGEKALDGHYQSFKATFVKKLTGLDSSETIPRMQELTKRGYLTYRFERTGHPGDPESRPMHLYTVTQPGLDALADHRRATKDAKKNEPVAQPASYKQQIETILKADDAAGKVLTKKTRTVLEGCYKLDEFTVKSVYGVIGTKGPSTYKKMIEGQVSKRLRIEFKFPSGRAPKKKEAILEKKVATSPVPKKDSYLEGALSAYQKSADDYRKNEHDLLVALAKSELETRQKLDKLLDYLEKNAGLQ